MSDLIKILLQAEISNDSIENIKNQLNEIQTNSKPINIKVNSTDAVKSIKDIDGVTSKINATNTKTWENANNEVYKYTQTLKNLEKGLTTIDTYTKNDKGVFKFTGRTIDDKSAEVTYKEIQKAHAEALKINKAMDDLIIKNHQMAKDSAWKQYFQGMTKTSKEIQQLNQYYSQLADNMEQAHEQAIKLNNEFDKLKVTKKNLLLDTNKMSNKYKNLISDNDIANIKSMIDALKFDDPNLGKNIDSIKLKMKEVSIDAEQSKKAIDLTNKSAMSFGKAMETAAYKFGIWSAITASYYAFIREIRKGIKFINEMNSALTEVGIVTGQTREQTAGLAEEYNKLAREMKVTTSEVTSGAVEFYRQGLSQEEVMKRLRTTTMYAKVANVDFKESAELLTATVNSMGIDIEKAADVFLYLGDSTATSGEEIAKGFSKTGGSASALGVEFEKVASWIAVISSKTRESAESIGYSINTILSRMSRITETGFNEEDNTSINDVSKALKSINMETMDSEGNFRNFGDILDEVSGKWSTLNDETKAYLANTLAGTRQQSRFYNLMDGYAESMKLYKGSLESAGTAQSKFNLYLESNQAKIDDFKAALEGLWISIIDSDALMDIVEGATKFIDVLDSMIDKFGVLGTVVSGIIPIIGIKHVNAANKAIKATIAQELANGKVEKSSIGLAKSFKLLIGQLFGVKTAADGAKTSFIGLNVATGIIGVALTVISVILAKISQKAREAEEAFSNALDDSQQMNDEINNLERLTQKQEKLSEIENKSAEEKEELLKVQRKLAQLYPELATGVDDEGNKLAENVEMTKQLTEEKRNLLEQELLVIKTTADTKLPQLKKELSDMQEEAKRIQDRLTSGDTFDTKYVRNGMARQINVTQKLKDRLLELIESEKDHIEKINKIEDGVKSYNQILEENVERQKFTRAEELQNQATHAQSTQELEKISNELINLGFTSEDAANIISGNLDIVKEKYKELDMEQIINLQTVENLDATHKQAALNMLENSRVATKQLITDTEARITAIQTEMNALIALTGGKAKQVSMISRKATPKDLLKSSSTFDMMATAARNDAIDAQRELAKLESNKRDIDKALANVKSIDTRKTSGLTSGKGSNKSGSKSKSKSTKDKPNEDKPTFLDSTDAEIRAIQSKNDNLEKSNELLREQLDLAKNIDGIEGLNKQYEINGKLIENNKKLLKSYKDEQTALHDKANNLRNKNKKYNIDSWFDANGEQTQAYINQRNDKLSKKEQENMDKVFQQMQKIKKAWMESDKEARNLVNTTKKLEKELDGIALKQEETVRNKVRETIEAEKRNAYLDLEKRQRKANELLEADKQKMERIVEFKQGKIDKLQKEIDDVQESERARAERKERTEKLKEISKLQNQYYYLQYTNLANISEKQAKLLGLEKEREQCIEYQTRMQEKQIQIQELQIKLDNIRKEKNIQQLKQNKDGMWDFEYVADQKSIDDTTKQIDDANKDIAKLQADHEKSIKDLKDKTLEDLKKAQESYDEWEIQRQIKAKQQRIKEYQDEIKDLQNNYVKKEKTTNEAFTTEKENLDRYYMDIDILTDEKMQQLNKTFGKNWSNIYNTVVGYFDDIRREYRSLVGELSQPSSTPNNGGDSGSSGYYEPPSGSGTSFTGNSKNKSKNKVDYGKGTAKTNKETKDNEARLNSDKAFRKSEIDRTKNVIKNRESAGMSTKDQEKYLKRLETGKYHEGGIVGDGSRDLPEAVNKLFNTKTDEQMVKAKLGELFVPKENLSKYFIPNMQEVFKSTILSSMNLSIPKMPSVSLADVSSGDNIYYINEMKLPNATDFDSFKKEFDRQIIDLPNKAIMKVKKIGR